MKNIYNQEDNDKHAAELPKKHVAVKLILKSTTGKILLVKPSYKPTWQLPGGAVEAGEDPRSALAREINEEIGLIVEPTKLHLIEYVLREDYDHLFLIFEYVEGVVETAQITLGNAEIQDYKFEEPELVEEQLSEYYHQFWSNYCAK